MMGVAGVPGWRPASVRFTGATVENTLFKDGVERQHLPGLRTDPGGRDLLYWSPPTGSGLRFSALPSPTSAGCTSSLLFVPVTWPVWMSAVGVVGLGLNLRAYDFVSQEIRAAEDPEFADLLHQEHSAESKGIRAWMAPTDQPHEKFVFPRRGPTSR